MLCARWPTANDLLHAAYPTITPNELRLEQKRIKDGCLYCLLAGAGK